VSDTTDIGTASSLPVRIEIPGYRIRRQVGSDSIGLWFDAEQESLQRKLTIKVLKPKYEKHEKAREHFLAEMDRLAGLDHANLTRLIDARRDDPLLLVVERIGVKSLETALRPAKPLAEGVALQTMLGVTRALRYLVRKGFAHKNVTPRFVMLRDEGHCRLVTFRNVLTLDELRALRGKLVQDSHYIAPEQLTGSAEIGGKTHVYQIGALLFHLFSGRAPFAPLKDQKELAKAHLQSEFPLLRKLQPFLRRAISDLIEACTQRPPDSRPSLEDLEHALALMIDGKDPGIKPGATSVDENAPKGIVAPKPRRRRRRRY